MQSSARRKKRRKSYLPHLLLSGMAIALLLLWLQSQKKVEKITPPSQSVKLLETQSPIENVTVSLDNGQSYVLQRKEGRLQIEKEGFFYPVEAKSAQLMEEHLRYVQAQNQILETSLPMPAMRLHPARIHILASFADGRQYQYFIGAQIPLSNDFYFMMADLEGIYAIHNGFEELFYVHPDSLIEVAELDVHKNLIKELHFSGSKNFSIELLSLESERAYGLLQAGFHYPSDAEYLYRMIASIDNISLGMYVEAYDTNKDYGFQSSESFMLRVVQYAGESETRRVEAGEKVLQFGKAADEFSVYVRFDDYVYRLSRIGLAPILDASVEKLLSREPFALSLLDVSNLLEIQDTFQGKRQVWRVDTVIKEADSEVAIYKNEQPYDLDAFKAMLKYVLEAKVDTVLPEPIIAEGEPLRSFLITLRGGVQMRIDFYSADAIYDYVMLNGVVHSKWAKQKTLALFSLEGGD